MLKIILLIMLFIHGLIHIMGFLKAFQLAEINQLTQNISRPMGILWLVALILFLAAAIQLISNYDLWWITGLAALILSQVLIILFWQDAKFGTIANIIILVSVIAGYGFWSFENVFNNDVAVRLETSSKLEKNLLTEKDIEHLPTPVQKYLRYAGVINKEKVNNVKIVFDVLMREKGKDWFKATSEQYNFFDEPTRLFFMKGKMFGMTVPGYHRYAEAKATMDIRLFGLFSMVKQSGEIMNKTETVTLFNDMCLMVPATLIDKRIQWEPMDSLTTKAVFTNRGISISATLYFNEAGQLINFISDDRTAISDMKQYRFSTPVKDYKNINGINVPTYGEAIWHYPDGEFVYGKFNLNSIEYNLSD
ncbi:MAG: cytochrome d ubiquinol oxidase subunit II [Ignavibacteria bacterium]|nr:cytochrome d ubiquinol oxidase subunit II [Ignavibacteria bacterium]